jgi:putative hydrolase of the HAD superfamily
MTVTAVLFDLDNTLTDRPASMHRFAQHFHAEFAEALHPDVTYDQVHAVIDEGDGGGYRPKEAMFQEICTELRWVIEPSPPKVAEYWYRVSPGCMELRAGVVSTLKQLQTSGRKIGMITNGKTNVQNATIDAIGVRAYFDTILVSETVGLRKPDARIFELALKHLDVPPREAVYVGDHPTSDVQGARNAGMRAIWFAGVHDWDESLPEPEYQIHQIAQLLDVLSAC